MKFFKITDASGQRKFLISASNLRALKEKGKTCLLHIFVCVFQTEKYTYIYYLDIRYLLYILCWGFVFL